MSTVGIGPAGLARGEYGHVLQGSSRNSQSPFGRTTERFFVEGEEHEARQWEDTILPPDDEPEPKRWRGRIDRVPRQKGAMLVLAVFAACLAFGIGMGVSAMFKAGTSVSDAVAAVRSWLPLTGTEQGATTGPPSAQPSIMGASLATPGSEQAQPLTIPTPAQEATRGTSAGASAMAGMDPSINASMGSQPAAPTQPAAPPRTGEPIVAPNPLPPGPLPVPAIVPPLPPPNPPAPTTPQKAGIQSEPGSPATAPAAVTAEPAAEAPSTARSDERSKASKGSQTSKQKKHRARRAEDNYVWSAELNALVPASTLENPQPGSPSDASSERSNQSSVTRTLRQMPNPFQKDDLSPPPLPSKASIAPATTGGPTDERPAPSGTDPFEK